MTVDPKSLFEILAHENADSLTAFLRASVSDRAAADDLFQETMLVAWRRIGEYDRSRPFGAWLRGIARRQVLAHYRRSAREVAFPGEAVLDLIDQRMAQVDRQPGDTFDDRIRAVSDCVDLLPATYRESVDLHYRQRRDTDWISRHLGTARDTIQKRLQRARQLLAGCLSRKGVFAAHGAPS